ncbi:hypothetical protein PV326_001517 [Microctonus aethiopoides]|nr:hypothetical protein PV326_001517 [Microctonus aethiopoides]
MNLRHANVCALLKQSLSPTLHISLSLAGADAFTAITLGTGLVMNSFIPYGLGIKLSGRQNSVGCLLLGLEAVRLGGVLITMGHLVTLAVNHYLGILRPLHYLSIMTHKITTTFIVILWILPLCFFITYFSLVKNEGFQSLNCQTNTFLFKKKFRTMFSSLFFGPFIFMVCIYVHIFYIVKKHQASRLRFSQAGSSFRRNEITDTQRHASQQLARNVKAVYTTLYILGSFVVGWMPATFLFVLVCEDCALKFDIFTGNAKFIIYNASNCLIIFKTLVNPIIYAARMHEIQLATRRMHSKFCGFLGLKNVSRERNIEVLPSSEGQSNRHLGIGRLMSVNGKRPRSYKYTYTGVKKNPQNRGTPYK